MDKVLEQAKQSIEVPAELPVAPPEPSGGFPWCGAGIVVGVVALAAVCAKLYKCTAKK